MVTCCAVEFFGSGREESTVNHPPVVLRISRRMVEEIFVVGDFQINVGIVFVVAHHLIGRAGVVAASRLLAARRWIVAFLLDSLVFGASILKPDFHLLIIISNKQLGFYSSFCVVVITDLEPMGFEMFT